MTEAALVALILLGIGGSYLLSLYWFDQIIRASVRRRIRQDELVAFESYAAHSSWRGIGRSYLVVTSRCLLFSAWILPPFWRLNKDVTLADIEEIEPASFLRLMRVRIQANGKRFTVMPQKSKYWPFADNKANDLIEAINRGRVAA